MLEFVDRGPKSQPRLTPIYRAVAGLEIEPLGDVWAAFSPRAGSSHLLNDASAAILEVLCLRPDGLDAGAVTVQVAEGMSEAPPDFEDLIAAHCEQLLLAGLVERLEGPAPGVAA